jgi:zinc/manganese transport system substrate-binding protein
MKKFLLIYFLFLLAGNAEAKLKILACEPEWAALARQIVQDKAEIITAMRSNQSADNIIVNSTLLGIARESDMLFCNGNDVELQWLPYMIKRSGNIKLFAGSNNLLLAADYAQTTQILRRIDFKQPGSENYSGENYSGENYLGPQERVHLNPHNITKIAAEFTRRVQLIDPLNKIFYQKSYEVFIARWDKSILRWEKKAAPLRNLLFVANDNSWSSLARWLGLKMITLYDPLTGAKPDLQTLYELVKYLKTNPAEAIIFSTFENKTSLLWLKDKTKIRLAPLPFTVGGGANSHDIFQLFETTLNSLFTDCSSGVCKTLAMPQTLKKNDQT